MKLSGISGQGSGKLGNMVLSVRAGEQIVRQYQPNVSNPSTDAQVETRSKLKLVSQLSKVVAPVIAIPREGLRSPRCRFISENYALAGFDTNEAIINLNRVQLTESVVGLGDFTANRQGGAGISVQLNENAPANIKAVTYVCLKKGADGSLSMFAKATQPLVVDNHLFATSLPYTDGEIVLYAYGVRDGEGQLSAKYQGLTALPTEQVAKLIASASAKAASITATKTKGLTLIQGQDSGSSDDVERATLAITITGNGSATGAGRYEIGTTVNCVATPAQDAEFVGWFRNGSLVSSNATYSITLNNDVTLEARFRTPSARYQISASANPAGTGTVTGSGEYEDGASCTLVASPTSGYRFVAWKENGSVVSQSASYTFTVTGARTLIAEFEQVVEGFSSVKNGAADWNGNILEQSSLVPSGDFEGSATKAAIIQAATAPTVGSTHSFNPETQSHWIADIQSGHFSMQGDSLGDQGKKYWLVAGNLNANTFTVTHVYEYYCQEEEVIS